MNTNTTENYILAPPINNKGNLISRVNRETDLKFVVINKPLVHKLPTFSRNKVARSRPTHAQLNYYKMKLELDMLKAGGVRWELLFTTIQQFRNPLFQQVKPGGVTGDDKSDGLYNEEGILYQLFATNRDTCAAYLEKLEFTFEQVKTQPGIVELWPQMKGFYFVVNTDQVYSKVHKQLDAYKKMHSLAFSEVYLQHNLLHDSNDLYLDDWISLYGFPPKELME